jgi:hypothetical protein
MGKQSSADCLAKPHRYSIPDLTILIRDFSAHNPIVWELLNALVFLH